MSEGYVAWDAEYPDEGAVCVWGKNRAAAVAAACRRLGYDVEELAEIDRTPAQVVTLRRVPLLDAYADITVTEDVEEAALREAVVMGRALEQTRDTRAMGKRLAARMRKLIEMARGAAPADPQQGEVSK